MLNLLSALFAVILRPYGTYFYPKHVDCYPYSAPTGLEVCGNICAPLLQIPIFHLYGTPNPVGVEYG